MTRHAPQRLYRAVCVHDNGHVQHFYLWAPDADMAADEAERQTGADCALVDDCTPRKTLVKAA